MSVIRIPGRSCPRADLVRRGGPIAPPAPNHTSPTRQRGVPRDPLPGAAGWYHKRAGSPGLVRRVVHVHPALHLELVVEAAQHVELPAGRSVGPDAWPLPT